MIGTAVGSGGIVTLPARLLGGDVVVVVDTVVEVLVVGILVVGVFVVGVLMVVDTVVEVPVVGDLVVEGLFVEVVVSSTSGLWVVVLHLQMSMSSTSSPSTSQPGPESTNNSLKGRPSFHWYFSFIWHGLSLSFTSET